ncbi:MAG: ABC transporter permease [Cycloclasticus sp.]|jgi:lipopolysaccharide transport system permease protein|nr:ABC transporter permease [Gammaproteobacteria bacterium]
MNLSLTINFTKKSLIDRYSGSVLGGLWAFIMPLVNMVVFILVFSKIMGARLTDFGADFNEYGYSIYLVSGILAWNAFASVLLQTTNVFKTNAGFISKVNINLVWLPLYIIISESVVFLISIVFFAIFLWAIGFPLTASWLFLPLVYALQVILAYGLGLLLATLSVFIKDIREFVTVVIQLWFWCTPIVYVVDILPENIQFWFQINPMYPLISAYRDIIMLGQAPEIVSLSYLLVLALLLVILATKVLKRLEKDVRDFI